MDLDDLAVEYYHGSLVLAQKGLLGGLTVAGVAYLVATNGDSSASYLVPIIGIEVTSFSYFTISLLILFIACGVICSYGINKALDNWRLISDDSLASRLLQVPSLFMLGIIVDSLLYGFLVLVGVSLLEAVFGLYGWKSFVGGSIVTLPYFFAFRFSSDLRHLRKTRDKS